MKLTNRKYRSYLTFIVCTLIMYMLVSCTGFEPVTINNPELSIDDAEPILVAEATLYEGSTVSLKLTYTKGLSVDTSVPTVCVENIEAPTLLNTDDGIIEDLIYSGDGLYVGVGILGEVNKSYTLSFTVDGLEYSSTATIYQAAVIDSGWVREYSKQFNGEIYYYYQPIWKVIDNPITRDYYMFRFSNKGAIDPSLTLVVDDDLYPNSDGKVQIKNDNIWLKGSSGIVIIASKIDKPTYNYYNQLQKLKWFQSTGDVTPYNPVSGFGNGSMGFFRALSSTSVEIGFLEVNNFVAMPDSGKNILSWTHVTGAVNYTIYWSSDSAITTQSDSIVIDSVITSYTHLGLTNGTKYYYKLKATDAFGASSELSALANSTPDVLIPPKRITIRPGDSEVIILWSEVPIASGYKIFWATDTNVTEQSDSIVLSTTQTSYTHTGLTNGTTYYYRMSSQSAAGNNSILSLRTQARPDSITIEDLAPQNVVATAGANEVTLTWDPVNDSANYVLYYDTIPWVDWSSIRIDSVTSPYIQAGLATGKKYYFRVASILGNDWYFSAEVNAIPDSIVITDQAPQNVVATAGANEISITWDTVNNAEKYILYWSTQPWVTKWSNSIDSVTTPFIHSTLDSGATYFYRVVSKIGTEEMEHFSMEVSATLRR